MTTKELKAVLPLVLNNYKASKLIVDHLENHTLVIEFEKKCTCGSGKGEIRQMICTRNADVLEANGYDAFEENEDSIIKVWDLEKRAIRSFSIHLLTKIIA